MLNFFKNERRGQAKEENHCKLHSSSLPHCLTALLSTLHFSLHVSNIIKLESSVNMSGKQEIEAFLEGNPEVTLCTGTCICAVRAKGDDLT